MSKKNIILGVVLIVLVAAAYVYQGPFKKWQSGTSKPKNFLAGINMDKATKIEIGSNKIVTTMEKAGDKWKISGTKDFFAKTEKVTAVIDKLKEAETADLEVISENKDKKGDFLTNNDLGTEVKMFDGDKQLVDVIVGKMSNDYTGTYISGPQDNKTYYVKVDLTNAVANDEWRDLTILSGDKAKINKIRFQYPDRQFTIEKKGDKWAGTLPKPFTVTTEKIDTILTMMTSLSASKIPEQTFKGTGLEKSKIIIQATGEGIDNTIMVANASTKDKNMYFTKRGNSDNIYLISKDQRTQLDKKSTDLK